MDHRTATRIGLAALLSAAASWVTGCTLEDVSDEIRVIEVIPQPASSVAPAHRIARTVAMGEESESVDEGHITDLSVEVLEPDDASLYAFLKIRILLRTGDETTTIAEATDFAAGERARDMDLTYTGNIAPFLRASDLEVIWEVYYRTSEVSTYPAAGIELELLVGFDVDVELL